MYKDLLTFFKNSAIDTKLRNVYVQVGSGKCSECTACCSESVNTFYSEYFAILMDLSQNDSFASHVRSVLRYYFSELVVAQKCPLLKENGHCAVYENRPLPCRVFGHLTQNEYDANYDELLKANVETEQFMKDEYGITVPESVYRYKVPFCKSFTTGNLMSIDERDALVDELFMVDSLYLSKGLLSPDKFNLSLVQWFAYDIFGIEDAQKSRIKVSQEISETGESDTLTAMLQSNVVDTWCNTVREDLKASS